MEVIVTVVVSDNVSNSSASSSFSATVMPVGKVAGVAVSSAAAGTPSPVNSGGTVNCSVTASDSLGFALSYSWTATDCVSGLSEGSFNNAIGQNPVWTAPKVGVSRGELVKIVVIVTDKRGASAMSYFTVMVRPVNDTVTFTVAPSGIPNSVTSSGQVKFNAVATDSWGSPVSYFWHVSDAQGHWVGTFDDCTKSNPLWTAPANLTSEPVGYVVRVCANSASGMHATAAFVESVLPIWDVITLTARPSGLPTTVAYTNPVKCSVAAISSLQVQLTYSWTAIDSVTGLSVGSFDNATSATPVWTPAKNISNRTERVNISVIVADAYGYSAGGSFTESVLSFPDFVSFSSRATANPNPATCEGQVLLNAAAMDSEGGSITYLWTAVDQWGQPAGFFDDPTSSEPVWTAPYIWQLGGATYTVTVTANSSTGATKTSSLCEIVTPLTNQSPEQ